MVAGELNNDIQIDNSDKCSRGAEPNSNFLNLVALHEGVKPYMHEAGQGLPQAIKPPKEVEGLGLVGNLPQVTGGELPQLLLGGNHHDSADTLQRLMATPESLLRIMGAPNQNSGDNLNAMQRLLRNGNDMVDMTGLNQIPTDRDPRRAMTRSELSDVASESAQHVRRAIDQLPKELRQQYQNMLGQKEGFTAEQLEFIKKNLPKDTYADALYTNSTYDILAGTKDRPFTGKLDDRMINSLVQEQHRLHIQVEHAIQSMSPRLRAEFDQIEKARNGSYTPLQLDFIQKHLPKETYVAANRYSDLTYMLMSR